MKLRLAYSTFWALSLVFLISLPQTSFAQQIKELLLDDSDVTWIVETEFEYMLEFKDRLIVESKITRPEIGVTNSKAWLVKSDPFIDLEANFFRDKLIYQIEEEILVAYDLKTEKPLSPMLFKSFFMQTDSIVRIDEFEKSTTLLRNDIRQHIKSLFIRQLWYYDQTAKQLRSVTLGVIPVLHQGEGDYRSFRKLCYIPFPEATSPFKFDINRREIRHVVHSKDVITFASSKILKGDQSTFKKLIWEEVIDGKTLPEEPWNSPYNTPVKPLYLNGLIEGTVDTVITFDPETFEEEMTVIQHKGVEYEEINFFQVEQLFYFDDKKQQISSYLYTIAPATRREGKKGKRYFNYLYRFRY